MKRLLLSSLLFVSYAFAQDCDSIVVDEAGIGDIASVKNTAKKLLDEGADVRVRVVSFLTAPTLDETEYKLADSCPSWQGGTYFKYKDTRYHAQKNNLIVLMMYIDREKQIVKKGLYFGKQWKSQLLPEWPKITAAMNPLLAQKLYVGALNFALLSTYKTVATPTSLPSPSTIIMQSPSKPTDLNGLWKVLGFLVGGGFFIWLCYIGIRWVTASKAEQSKKLGAQQAAKQKQTIASGLIAEVSSLMDTYDTKKDLHTAGIIRSTFDAANAIFSGITDPNTDKLQASEYLAIRDEYIDVISKLEKIRDLIQYVPGNDESSSSIYGSSKRSAKKEQAKEPRIAKQVQIPEEAHHAYYQSKQTVIFIPEPVLDRPYDRPSYIAPDDSPSGGSNDSPSSSSSDDDAPSGGSSDYSSDSSSSDSSSSDSAPSGGE